MAMKVVLDTNIVLYFLAGRLLEPLPIAQFYVSVINQSCKADSHQQSATIGMN